MKENESVLITCAMVYRRFDKISEELKGERNE